MSGKKPVTNGYQADSDITYLFRTQDRRTLAEIDTLMQRQQQLRTLLGEEKAAAIEKQPDLYYNHERFRIWQAQARFRALVATVPTVMIVSTVLNGGRGGYELIKRKWCIALPAIAFTYMTYFSVIHRLVGYNNQTYHEQAFAKNFKMLRNLIIKQ